MKRIISLTFIIVISLFMCTGCFNKDKDNKPKVPKVKYTKDFNMNLIKVTRRDSNYLISPYSIEVALNMLKEGANNNTRKQIESVLPNRNINDISVKDRIKIANAIFIKDDYKNKVKDSYKDLLVNKYDSEVLYDKFKTPDVINNWVDQKTDGMIKRVIDDIDPDFVLGLANAISIDVKWNSEFECNKTKKESFTKSDGKKINVEMMHNEYKTSGYKYLETKDAKGIILTYRSYDEKTGKIDNKDGRNLEFIAILPNESVDSYIDNLTTKKLDELINSGKNASTKYEIRLSLPRFKYGYEIPNFQEILEDMGIKDVFSFENADFTKIMDKKNMKTNLYVSDAVHKTYIDLNEVGTKAAAVTYFGMKDFAAIEEKDKKVVEIKFNKPFIYMIRDQKTKELLFFGAVYSPNLWNKTTCENM